MDNPLEIVMTDEEIVAALKADVYAAIALGMHIKMNTIGVSVDARPNRPTSATWQPRESCAMCVMGTRLLNRHGHGSIKSDFARSVGKPYDWGEGFMVGSDSGLNAHFLEWAIAEYGPSDRAAFSAGWQVGQRMLEWVREEGLQDG